MNCLSWIYILKKQTILYSESHKELAFLPTFSAMRKSRSGGLRRAKHLLQQNNLKTILDIKFLFSISGNGVYGRLAHEVVRPNPALAVVG